MFPCTSPLPLVSGRSSLEGRRAADCLRPPCPPFGAVNGEDANLTRYNLAGQRVGKNYKGIVIENGHKVVRK